MTKCTVCGGNAANCGGEPFEVFDPSGLVFYAMCPNCRLRTKADELSVVAFGRTAQLLDRIAKLEARVASLEERLPEPDGK